MVIVTGFLGYQAYQTPRDLSFTGILDEDDVEMMDFRKTVDTFGGNSMLVVLIEGEASEVDRTIALLSEKLATLPAVKTITPPANPQWLVDRAPWLWPRPMFDNVVRAVESGTPNEGLEKSLTATDGILQKALRPVPEAALLGIGLHRNPLDIAMGGGDFYTIESATDKFIAEGKCEVTYAFTGLAAAAAQDQQSVMGRIKLLTPLTLLAVLLLLMLVERRLSRVLAAGVALSFAVVIAFGLTGLTLGRLSIIVTFFSMLLLGLGIDFGIHLLVSLRDARAHGKNAEDSVRFGLRHTATAIALGGVSTALAFGMVALAPEPGARDMGFVALYGLLAALLLMLTFLPAVWLLLERRHANLDSATRFNLPGLRATVTFSLNHPRLVLVISAILTAISLAGIPRYELEQDLKKIISRSVTAFDVDERLAELFDVSPVTYIAPVESLEQAREWAIELVKFPDIAAVTSAADIILVDAEERIGIANTLLANLPQDRAQGPLYDRLQSARDLGLITVENIPNSIANGLRGENGELAVSIVPKENVLDARILDKQINRIRTIAPTASGMPIIIRLAVSGTRDYVPIMIPAILIVVSIVLTIAFRNPKDVMLALLPVIIGTANGFGVFLWFDLRMSLLTSVVVPVILGLGVDDGIHVVERLRQYKFRDDAIIHAAVEGVGRAIFLTTATTCVSFVSLLFTNHAGLEGIAQFMLIGIPICFIASVTALPAAAKLFTSVPESPPES